MLVCVVALALGACGAGGGVTHAEYVRAAAGLCRHAAREVAAVPAPDPGDPRSVAKAASMTIAAQRRALAGLRRLPTPSAERDQLVRWLALVDQTLDEDDRSTRAQSDGDLAAATEANANGRLLAQRAASLAKAVGLADCAPPPPASS